MTVPARNPLANVAGLVETLRQAAAGETPAAGNRPIKPAPPALPNLTPAAPDAALDTVAGRIDRELPADDPARAGARINSFLRIAKMTARLPRDEAARITVGLRSDNPEAALGFAWYARRLHEANPEAWARLPADVRALADRLVRPHDATGAIDRAIATGQAPALVAQARDDARRAGAEAPGVESAPAGKFRKPKTSLDDPAGPETGEGRPGDPSTQAVQLADRDGRALPGDPSDDPSVRGSLFQLAKSDDAARETPGDPPGETEVVEVRNATQGLIDLLPESDRDLGEYPGLDPQLDIFLRTLIDLTPLGSIREIAGAWNDFQEARERGDDDALRRLFGDLALELAVNLLGPAGRAVRTSWRVGRESLENLSRRLSRVAGGDEIVDETRRIRNRLSELPDGIARPDVDEVFDSGILRNQQRGHAPQYNEGFVRTLRRRRGEDPDSPIDSDLPSIHRPYDENFPVFTGFASDDVSYIRVFSEGGRNTGEWMMREAHFDAIMRQPNPGEILQELYALPAPPAHFVRVTPPAGTRIRVGSANGHAEWGGGGGLQYQLPENFSRNWFDTDNIGTIE